MGERESRITFLVIWAGSHDLISKSMLEWLEYYEEGAYEQILEGDDASFLVLIDDVANGLDEIEEFHYADTTRAGGVFVHHLAFSKEEKGLRHPLHDLGMYKLFLATISKSVDKESEAHKSLILAQQLIQGKLDEINGRIFPDKDSPNTSTQS